MDKYGRKLGVLIAIVTCICFLVIPTFPPTNFWLFLASRFMLGVGDSNMYNGPFIWAVEFTGARHSAFVSLVLSQSYCIGAFIVTGMAYFLMYWTWLHIACACFGIPALLLALYAPESPRWLIAMEKEQEALEIMKTISKMNNLSLEITIADIRKPPTAGIPDTDFTFRHLFTCKELLKRLIVLSLVWFSISMCFVGISFNLESLHGSIHSTMLYTESGELVGIFVAFLLANRWGRLPLLSSANLVCGISCLVVGVLIWLDRWHVEQVIFCALAKLAIAAGYGQIWVYCAELFPTNLRSTSMGICMMIGRIGG